MVVWVFFVVICPHNSPGEIGSPLVVRDESVFRRLTIAELKWLLQMFIFSLLQVREHSSVTSVTPPSRGRTRSTSTSRWCTTATRSTSATCARRLLSLLLSSRATRRWVKRAGARRPQSYAVIARLLGLCPEIEFKHNCSCIYLKCAQT